MSVPVLYRHPSTGLLEPIESRYEGPLSPKVWKRINREFLKLDAAGYFFPMESLDAYSEAIREVERTAERIAKREIVLETSSAETYLASTAKIAFHHFHLRVVSPMRDEYRRVEKKVLEKEERDSIKEAKNAAEGADVGAATFAAACETGENAEPPQPMTAQQLAEALPGEPNAETRRREAAFMLEEIFAKLQNDAVIAFRAYIAAEGNMLVAARGAKMSKSDFYRKWPGYLAMARKVVS